MRNRVQFPDNRAAIDELYAKSRHGGGGGSGISAEDHGIPVPGGPFTTVNVLGSLSAVNGGGGVLAVTGTSSPSIVGAQGFKLGATTSPDVSGDYQYLQPIDGVSDDWPRLMAAAALGPVVMLPGKANEHWQCLSVVETPSGALIIGTPDTVVDFNLPTGAETDAVFAHDATIPGGGFSTTLASVPVLGSKTLPLTSTVGLAPGDYIAVDINVVEGNIIIYQVVALPGGDNVTVDRPIVWPDFFAFTAVVGVTNVARNVRILGNGMTLHHVAGAVRAIEFLGSFDCLVDDVVVDWNGGGSGDFLCSYNTGGVRNTWRRIRTFNGAGTAIALETQEFSIVEDCSIDSFSGASTAGIGINDSYGCESNHNRVAGCNNGLGIGPDGGNGCYNTLVNGGSYDGCTTNGIFVFSGTTKLVGVSAGYSNINCSISDGATTSPGGTPLATSISVSGCRFHDAQGVGSTNLSVRNTGTVDISDTDLSSTVVSGGTSYGFFQETGTSGPSVSSLKGVSVHGNSLVVIGIYAEGTCTIDLTDCHVDGCTSIGVQLGIFGASQAVTSKVDGLDVPAPAGGYAVAVGYTCDSRLANVVVPSAGGGSIGLAAGDCVVRIEPGCNFEQGTTPVLLFSGAVSNRWAFAASGGALTIGFPIAGPLTETVSFERDSGGTGLSPTVTRVIGTSVTITPQTGDATTTGNVTVL